MAILHDPMVVLHDLTSFMAVLQDSVTKPWI